MRRIVVEALRAGAIGFATSTLEQHNGENGIPMPSRLADEREMTRADRRARRGGTRRVHADQGHDLHRAVAREIAAANGRPVMIAAMFVDPGDPTRVFRELGEIEAARSRGPRAVGTGGLLPARHGVHAAPSLPARGVPRLAARHRGRRRGGATGAVLADPSFRDGLKEEIGQPGVPNRFSDKNWQHLTITEVTRPEHRSSRARPSAPWPGQRGQHPLGHVPRLRPRRRAGRDVRLPALQHRRERGAQAAAASERGGGALRRRRASVVPVRRGLRPAPVRPLGARARRPHARAGGASA